MKAKDLMIGDYGITEGNDGENYVVKVVAVYNNGLINFDGIGMAGISDSLNPIPLTPEILEKIGFETQPNIGYIIDDYDGIQIIYDSWNNNLRIIKDYKTCLDIKTFNDLAVHELQHALRICGIEKEIIL